MKSVFVILGSFEKANLHRSFYNSLKEYRNIDFFPFLFDGSYLMEEKRKNKINDKINHILKNKEFDLILTIGGYGLTPKAFNGIKTKKVSWQIDDPYSRKMKVFPNIMKMFDVNFTTSKNSLDLYKKQGIKIHYLPFGFSPDYHFPLDDGSLEALNYPDRYDISFIGTSYPNRIEYLKELNKISGKYRIFISGSRLPFCTEIGRISHEKTALITQRSKISINFSDQPDGVLDAKNRLCEISGCGSMLLTQNFYSLSDYFVDGKECVSFNNPKEMIDKIKYYLDSSFRNERINITKDGTKKSFYKHTYKKRIEEMFRILSF